MDAFTRRSYWTSATTLALLVLLFATLPLRRASVMGDSIAAAEDQPDPIAPAQSTAPIPAGWQRITPLTDTFSIALPPGWTYVERPGIDSLIGEFVGDGIRLVFDYGLYSNPLAGPGDPGYEVSFEHVDCKQAKIVEAEDAPARITGIYFGGVNRQRFGGFEAVTKLQVNGTDLEPLERALVLQIVRTIRFESRCLSTGLGDWEIFDAPLTPDEVPVALGLRMRSSAEGWAVGGMRPTDVVTQGLQGCSMLRYDGTAWRSVACPAEAAALRAVDLDQDGNGWATGVGEMLRLESGAWTRVAPPGERWGTLFDLRLAGAKAGWAIGIRRHYRLQDGVWEIGEGEAGGIGLDLSGPGEGWAVSTGELRRLSDGRWSEPLRAQGVDLGGVGVDAEGERVWMCGHNVDSGLGEIIGYDPSLGPFEVVEFADSSQVQDLDLFPDGTGFAVGGNEPEGPAMVFERRGGLWTPYSLPFDGVLMDLDMISEVEGWAVGYRVDRETGGAFGVMLRYSGHGGPQQETPVATVSVTATPLPMTTTPASPGTISPTPNGTPTWTPTPASPPDTAEPGGDSAVYLPMVVNNAEVESSAGKQLIVGMSYVPDTLYMYGGTGQAMEHVFAAIYDAPFDTLGYRPVPNMVEALPKPGEGLTSTLVNVEPGERYVDPGSGEVLEAETRVEGLEQLEVRWTFKDVLHWEDGFPVTAADSVFSRMLECDPDTPSDKFLCERSADYRAEGARTVVWTGLPGFVSVGFEIFVARPLPRHQQSDDGRRMEALTANEILEDPVLTRRPLANGPFRIVEWDSGNMIVLERNPWYRRGETDLPHLESLIIQFIWDPSDLLPAMRAGAVDVVLPGLFNSTDSDALDMAEEQGWLEPFRFSSRVWEQLSFNVDPVASEDVTPTPFGACRELRQAVSMAIDRETIVDVNNAGIGGGMYGIVPPGHWAGPVFFGSFPAHLRFDPEGAKAKLQDMGFVDDDGDGVREASRDIECLISREDRDDTRHVIPAGTALTLRYLTSQGNSSRENIAGLIASWLSEVGIEAMIDPLPANILFADGPDGPLFGRSGFELGQFAWYATDVPELIPYRCSEIPGEENDWSGRNLTGWCDLEFEREGRMLERSLDRDAALLAALAAQDRFIEDVPAIPLYPRAQIAAARTGLVGLQPDPSSASLLWNIETWRWRE